MYTKRKLGEELKLIIENSFNIVRISKWAERTYAHHCRELSLELDEIIMALSSMEHGQEFEYTYQELREMAQMLLNDEENLLKKINERRLNEKK